MEEVVVIYPNKYITFDLNATDIYAKNSFFYF